MSFISKLFSKPRKDISRADALSEISSLSTVAAFFCRIGYIISGLQMAAILVTVLIVLIPGTVQGQFHFVENGAGDILYQSLDGTFWVGFIQDNKTFVSQALSAILRFLIFSTAVDFFKAISKTEKPFVLARAYNLKRIGALLVLLGVVPDALGVVSIWLSHPYTAGMSYGVSIFDTAPLAAGIIVFVFARVFEYGCVLQEQDDALL